MANTIHEYIAVLDAALARNDYDAALQIVNSNLEELGKHRIIMTVASFCHGFAGTRGTVKSEPLRQLPKMATMGHISQEDAEIINAYERLLDEWDGLAPASDGESDS